jgi:hypothetical protein
VSGSLGRSALVALRLYIHLHVSGSLRILEKLTTLVARMANLLSLKLPVVFCLPGDVVLGGDETSKRYQSRVWDERNRASSGGESLGVIGLVIEDLGSRERWIVHGIGVDQVVLGVNLQHPPDGDHEPPLSAVVGEEEGHCSSKGDGDDLVLSFEKSDQLEVLFLTWSSSITFTNRRVEGSRILRLALK